MSQNDSKVQELTKLVEVQIETIANDAVTIQELQKQLNEKNAELDKFRAQQVDVTALQKELDKFRAQQVDVTALQKELETTLRECAKLKELKGLEEELSEKSDENSELQKQLQEQASIAVEIQEQLQKQTSELKSLQKQFQKQSSTVKDLQKQLQERNNKIKELQKQTSTVKELQKQSSTVKDLQKQLQEKSGTIDKLQKQLRQNQESLKLTKDFADSQVADNRELSKNLESLRDEKSKQLKALREETYLHKVYQREFEYLKDFCETIHKIITEVPDKLKAYKFRSLTKDNRELYVKDGDYHKDITDILSEWNLDEIHMNFIGCNFHFNDDIELIKYAVEEALRDLQDSKRISDKTRSNLIDLLRCFEVLMICQDSKTENFDNSLTFELSQLHEIFNEFSKSVVIVPYEYHTKSRKEYFSIIHSDTADKRLYYPGGFYYKFSDLHSEKDCNSFREKYYFTPIDSED